jgi:SAM-dependent methyltransferase
MTDRADGYVTDVGYTFGYHAALNPRRCGLAMLRAGFAPPVVRTACELGFGQGVSLVVHAAASDVRWWGNDLLPDHVRFADDLAQTAGVPVSLSEASFAEYLERSDLPPFDFIGLHGVLSWVSAENRSLLVEFIRRHLAPGGIVYAGYNALPGWNTMIPWRGMLVEHASRSERGSTVERIDAAIDFAARLLDANPLHALRNPALAERFDRIRNADRRYLAHEYFNRDWHPLAFAEVAELFGRAGLGYACSAHLPDHLEAFNLTAEQRAILADIGDPVFRETVRDLITNAMFRRDCWVREPSRLTDAQCEAQWRRESVVLATPREAIPAKVSGVFGDVRFDDAVTDLVLSVLDNHRPHTLDDFERRGLSFSEAVEATFALMAFGHVESVLPPGETDRARPRTAALNARLLELAEQSDDIAVLASPVTGGGIAVSRLDRLFLAVLLAGKGNQGAWCDAAGAVLGAGAPPRSELERLAASFAQHRLPVLAGLGIAP